MTANEQLKWEGLKSVIRELTDKDFLQCPHCAREMNFAFNDVSLKYRDHKPNRCILAGQLVCSSCSHHKDVKVEFVPC